MAEMNIYIKEPLISVIVPCYKVEQYISKCVDSIINQTYHNLEIFLVDDGSPDNCGKICDEYAAKDNRVKVIHKENGGLSDARNAAIDIAKGEWITFVDSDDYISLDYVEILYRLAERHKCKMSVAQHIAFYEEEEPAKHDSQYTEICQESIEAIRDMFYYRYYDTSAWAKLYHKSLFDKGIRYPKGTLHEDFPTTYLLLAESDKVAYCNKSVYYYLLRKNSIERAAFNNKKLESFWMIDKMMKEHLDLLEKVWNGYICKRTSFAFHIFLQMPKNHKETERVYRYAIEYRDKILFDRKAQRKVRIACALSYMGASMVRTVFQLIGKR